MSEIWLLSMLLQLFFVVIIVVVVVVVDVAVEARKELYSCRAWRAMITRLKHDSLIFIAAYFWPKAHIKGGQRAMLYFRNMQNVSLYHNLEVHLSVFRTKTRPLESFGGRQILLKKSFRLLANKCSAKR